MRKCNIFLVAYQNQENLGVGYLSSMLLSRGYNVENVDFSSDKEEIFQQISRSEPLLVGFSLIYQHYTQKLAILAKYLRAKGVTCHFTVGGHYPSLRFEELLSGIPDMDSVVRFEGEFTLCELAQKLSSREDWRTIKGIGYRKNDKPFSNDLRPLISNLDILPFPLRNNQRQFNCYGKNCAFILGSRGCLWNCSFCSIRQFYGTPPGGLRRTRSVENIVKEIKELFEKNSTCIFLFQDDDFFSPGKLGKKRALDFINTLKYEGLSDNILWKVSCRSNDVDVDLFKLLKKAGLCIVYLGIESGNPTGLELLNKHLTVKDNLRAVEILTDLDIICEFGFMLTDPSSTFDSVRANLDFLKKACTKGNIPVTFTKMVPLAETSIEKKLYNEGRLKGSIETPDYDFFDPKLDDYCRFLHRIFGEWIFSPEGLLAQTRWKQFEVAVLEKFYPNAKCILEYKSILKKVIASSNDLFFQVATDSAKAFEEERNDEGQFQNFEVLVSSELEKFKSTLSEAMLEFHKRQQL